MRGAPRLQRALQLLRDLETTHIRRDSLQGALVEMALDELDAEGEFQRRVRFEHNIVPGFGVKGSGAQVVGSLGRLNVG